MMDPSKITTQFILDNTENMKSLYTVRVVHDTSLGTVANILLRRFIWLNLTNSDLSLKHEQLDQVFKQIAPDIDSIESAIQQQISLWELDSIL